MSRTELRTFYGERERRFSFALTRVVSRINLISNARLFTAVVFFVTFFIGLDFPVLLFLLPAIAFAFALLVRYHGKLFDKKHNLSSLAEINRNELQALTGILTGFPVGSEFTDVHNPFTGDLDIFGPGSLFQAVNRANSVRGRQLLAQRLSRLALSADEIRSRQEAIAELAQAPEFRQEFQAAGTGMEEQPGDFSQLLAWSVEKPFLYGRTFYTNALNIIPVITLAAIAAAFFLPVFRPVAILLAAIQWGFTAVHMKRIQVIHDAVSRKANILKKYARLLAFVSRGPFTSTHLTMLSARAADADKKIDELASLVFAFDARLNSMTMLLVNSVLLYDLQCVYRLEKWKHENAARLQGWFDTLSESEVLNSFATFSFNHPGFCFPQIQEKFEIEATAMGHPLIADECVTNDLRIGAEHSVMIVTGANMAGKSTFLRTVGVNIILALNGAPVFATAFTCPVLRLRTGMRTADSLKDHQSYFYAELDRLKGIMGDLRSDVPLLILLDEILKGTNSADKQAGSIALVKQLLLHPCLAIVATHDLALGDLEKQFPRQVKNFSFEAQIENDQLSFDYRLKAGIARNMNATFLMKKMGIIPS